MRSIMNMNRSRWEGWAHSHKPLSVCEDAIQCLYQTLRYKQTQADNGLPLKNHTPTAVFSALWAHVWLQMRSSHIRTNAQGNHTAAAVFLLQYSLSYSRKLQHSLAPNQDTVVHDKNMLKQRTVAVTVKLQAT